jgi:hypothetical protein
MPTVCIQCSMRAMLAGEPAPSFDESPEAHLARVHPDPIATARERADLERQLAEHLRPPPTDNRGIFDE